MFAFLGATVDALHALSMLLWVVGIPLLFWHRWPRLTYLYSGFAIVFIVLNVTSQWMLGECFLTTVSRFFWTHSSGAPPEEVQEWFTVRFARWVFHMTPSHGFVERITELLILVCGVGAFYSTHKLLRGHAFPRHRHA